jgi:HAD superfamily phosphatase
MDQSMPASWAIAIFDIDGVVRDVGGSYRRALADTVEHFTQGAYRPTPQDIDTLKAEGRWNNDWEASQEFIYRHFEAQGQPRAADSVKSSGQTDRGLRLDYDAIVRFFQSRYRGTDPVHWNGYIRDEPLLMTQDYGRSLTDAGILWGFFSGATTGSARYVLETRIGLQFPVLVAMEDAPGKPNPTGLFLTLQRLQPTPTPLPVLYVGDTVADMYTIAQARQQQGDRPWFAVGILPPHVQDGGPIESAYREGLTKAGAAIVLNHVQALTPAVMGELVGSIPRTISN